MLWCAGDAMNAFSGNMLQANHPTAVKMVLYFGVVSNWIKVRLKQQWLVRMSTGIYEFWNHHKPVLRWENIYQSAFWKPFLGHPLGGGLYRWCVTAQWHNSSNQHGSMWSARKPTMWLCLKHSVLFLMTYTDSLIMGYLAPGGVIMIWSHTL